MLRISLTALVLTFAQLAAAEAPRPPAPAVPRTAPPPAAPPTAPNTVAPSRPSATSSPAGVAGPAAAARPAAATGPAAGPAASPARSAAGSAPAARSATATTATTATTAASDDKLGVVLVEQAGRVAALGVVLNGDGRVVTAFSRLTPGQLFVRYANGTLEAARVGHTDPARDLALLVPKTARWQKGVPAARDGLASPLAAVKGFSLGVNRTLSTNTQALAGTGELGGRTVLKLGSTPKPNELGGPLLDSKGEAVGIVVSGCAAGTANCSAPPVGLPVNEVRAFLRTRPAAAGYALPRLGVGGLSADTGTVRGLLITSIEAKTPAAALGLRVGTDPSNADVLVAVAGTPVPNEDALRNELARHSAGDRVELLVFGKDGYRVLATRLAAPSLPAPLPAVQK